MNIVALMIFALSSWAVLSHKFDDGIVAKHLLSLSAITAFISIMDKDNLKASAASGIFLFLGIVYGLYKHRRLPIRPNKPRPLKG